MNKTSVKQSHPRLREAIKILSSKKVAAKAPKAFKLVIWELMNTQTRLSKLERFMDKQIHKVKADVKTGDKKKALHDIGTLEKMDKKFDRKLEKCSKVMKKKSKKR